MMDGKKEIVKEKQIEVRGRLISSVGDFVSSVETALV